MSVADRQGVWPMNHRNQVSVIESMLARMATMQKRLDDLGKLVAPDVATDDRNGDTK